MLVIRSPHYSFHHTKQSLVPAPTYRFLRPYTFKAYCLFTSHPDLLPYFFFNPLTQTGVLRHAEFLQLSAQIQIGLNVPIVSCLCVGVYAHRGNYFYISSSFSAYINHTSAWWGEEVNGLTQPHFCPMERSVFNLDPSGEATLPIKVSSLEGKMETMLPSCCYLIVDIVKIKPNKKENPAKFLACSKYSKNVGPSRFQTAEKYLIRRCLLPHYL